MDNRIAIFAGSLDPITNGHLWVLREGIKLFDKVIIGIGTNSSKTPTFTIEERKAMLEWIFSDYIDIESVEIHSYENEFLVDFAKNHNASYVLRGIRSVNDYMYEYSLNNLNTELGAGSLVSVFLMPPRELSEISSSMVKSLTKYQRWQEILPKYVPQIVVEKMIEKFK